MESREVVLNTEEFAAVFASLIQQFGEMSIALNKTTDINKYEAVKPILDILGGVIMSNTGLDADELYEYAVKQVN